MSLQQNGAPNVTMVGASPGMNKAGKRIMMLAVLGLALWLLLPVAADMWTNLCAGSAKSAQGPPTFTLKCGEGYHRLPQVELVKLIVPASDSCWTPWQAMPSRINGPEPRPQWDVDNEVTTEVSFGDGSTKQYLDSPSKRYNFEKEITAVRFQNAGTQPVTINLRLYRLR